MPEQNKNITTINFLVLSVALWVFTASFSLLSFLFAFLVNLFSINDFFKNINEYTAAIILGILVFIGFTFCIVGSENIIKKFLPNLLNKKLLSIIVFIISVVGMYYILGLLVSSVGNII